MFKNKQLEYVEHAFEIERYSYDRLITHLRVKVSNLETELEAANNTTVGELRDSANKEITKLEVENANLRAKNVHLEVENERPTKELEQCGKKLSATQYKEYKRLKQKEYTQRYLKKKAQKSSK